MRTARHVLLAALALVVALRGAAGEPLLTVLETRPAVPAAGLAPVLYWQEARKEPRALRINCVRVDLTSKEVEAVALIPPDPDGDGPAEAVLEKPLALAGRPGVLAAVNANAFAGVASRPVVGRASGTPADIRGWAKDETRQASPPQPGYANFWLDTAGRGHIGTPAAPAEARLAVAGFAELLRDGKAVAMQDKPLHPRTAAGLDAAGQTLYLVVVDGRQAGYSEGMSLAELAALMKELGCENALNLDGGGSACMVVAKPGEKLSVANRPSDAATRAVPVMLGVRERRRLSAP